jgi:hypothetical protein
MILVETQQHGIVDDAAFRVGDEGVLALPYSALIEIAGTPTPPRISALL